MIHNVTDNNRISNICQIGVLIYLNNMAFILLNSDNKKQKTKKVL